MAVRLFFVLCLFSAGTLQAADDWQRVLKKIEQTVAEAVDRSDNYICTQELSRLYYATTKTDVACRQPPAIPPVSPRLEDRLKLDVAVSEGNEIYSWFGEHKFSAADVSQVVRDGPISSGSFNGYLRNIFGEHGVQFVFQGRSTGDGLDLYHFDYDVPLASSHYSMQAGKSYVLTPFHGSFTAVADTFALYSLTVTATGDQIPQRSDICSAETRLTYQMVQIANHKSLLPASFDLLMGSRTGIFTDSKGKYSGCREYTGESTVHFDMDDTGKPDVTPVELQTEPLKSGVHLPIALRGEIDEGSAYAGLPVDAVLVRNVKVRKDLVLSRGATLRGTVTRFQIFHQPEHRVSLKIEFNSITDGNKLYLCNAIHEIPEVFLPTYAGGGRRMGGVRSIGMQSPPDEPTDGSMLFNARHMHLDRSFSTNFVTVDPSQTESQ
jgi:hypothetical protein